MKKVYLLLLILLLPVLSACSTKNGSTNKEDDNQEELSIEVLDVDENGNTSFNHDNLNFALDNYNYLELTDLEKQGILYMIEEEKLAHDVYAFLFDKWAINVFSNISKSELTHTTAVQNLAQRYEVAIPESIDELGKYENSELQKLYNDLTSQGSKSIEDALKVGAAIEEIDILDLEKYIAQTEKEDIKIVYENLMKGSRNHLRSFVRNIGDYSPQYLDQGTYDEIVNSETERGGSGRGGQNSGQGSGNGRN